MFLKISRHLSNLIIILGKKNANKQISGYTHMDKNVDWYQVKNKGVIIFVPKLEIAI